MTKVIKSFRLANGVVVPAGTNLKFGTEGVAFYKGSYVNKYRVPKVALENVGIDPTDEFKSFDSLQPGDAATGIDGQPITIVGKGTGKSGYDALFNEFGNIGTPYEELVANVDEGDIDTLNFVAYSNADSEICIDIYDAEHITATEADETVVKAFAEVEPADKAITHDGKNATVLAKGTGKVWFLKESEAFGLSDEYDAKCDEDTCEFVLVKFDDGTAKIMPYCPETGCTVKVTAAEPEASVEAIMLAAKKRWYNGGRERYARMQAQAATESICIVEDDDAIRDNIKMELTDSGIEFTEGDNGIEVEDNDDNAEILAKLAQTYPSINAAMSEAGIECMVKFVRK